MKDLHLKIEGMHCKHCAAFIKMLFEDEVGVEVDAVDYTSGDALIRLDENLITEQKIVDTINETQYRVKEVVR